MGDQVKHLFEDNALLVVHKPAGLVVNRSQTQKQPTLQDYLMDYFNLNNQGIGDRAGIVHRLDKETSGVLVIAKTNFAFESLQQQFKKRTVDKIYTVLIHGLLKEKEGKIEEPIARNPYNRTKFGVFAFGRPSLTFYKVKELFNKHSLVKAFPKTGRTHQIRVHFKYINHPVVGDALYAGRKTARSDRRWCPRQFLHASHLEFTHPETAKRVKFEDPLPNDLVQALEVAKREK